MLYRLLFYLSIVNLFIACVKSKNNNVILLLHNTIYTFRMLLLLFIYIAIIMWGYIGF